MIIYRKSIKLKLPGDAVVYVYINQQDATLLMNDLYSSLIGSTCFGLSPVHHQEYHLINCITHWYVRAGESSCCVDVYIVYW